jgi:hypothetical protein
VSTLRLAVVVKGVAILGGIETRQDNSSRKAKPIRPGRRLYGIGHRHAADS